VASPHEATAPSFREFWQSLLDKTETWRELRKITIRLESIFHLELFKERSHEPFSLAELFSQVTVLDLHRIEIEENQRAAASFFLQRLYREMFGRAEVQQLRYAVVFDEAHRVARLTLISKVLQECRKYGILFVLSSQRIEDFNQGVLDSAGNYLYLRVNHPDARRLASYRVAGDGAGDIAQQLQNLDKYDALYRSEDYQTFAHVRLAEL
jgi:DNA helicase HerA-like ATPase